MATVDIADVHDPIVSRRKEQIYEKLYYLTLNPNIRFPEGDEPDLDPFCAAVRNAIKEVLNNRHKFLSTLSINKRVTEETKAKIDSSLSKFVVERGHERGIVHAHGIIHIKSPIKNLIVSYKMFPATVLTELKIACEEAGLRIPTNLYPNFEPLDHMSKVLNEKQRIMDYIRKEMKEPEDTHMSFVGERKQRAPRKRVREEEDVPDKAEQENRIKQIRKVQKQVKRKIEEEPEQEEESESESEEEEELPPKKKWQQRHRLEYPYPPPSQEELEDEESDEDEDDSDEEEEEIEEPPARKTRKRSPSPEPEETVQFVQLKVPKYA